MNLKNKRKLADDNNISDSTRLTGVEAEKMLNYLTDKQMLEILKNATIRHVDVLDEVRSIVDRDTTHGTLFVRELDSRTTSAKLRAVFSSYGDVSEAAVVEYKHGKGKGYGFVTFKHVDEALLALREPNKVIDGQLTVSQLHAPVVQRVAGGKSLKNPVDESKRKIYVANVPYDMPAESLSKHFAMYGELEKEPLGFDKFTCLSKGFALILYKTAEGAQACLVDRVKKINGHQLKCRMAIEKKKGKAGPGGAQVQAVRHGVPIGADVQMGIEGQNVGHAPNSTLDGVNGIGMGVPDGSVSSGSDSGIRSPDGGRSNFVGPSSTKYGALDSTAGGDGLGSARALKGCSSTRYGPLDSTDSRDGFGSVGALGGPNSTRYGALYSTASGDGVGSGGELGGSSSTRYGAFYSTASGDGFVSAGALGGPCSTRYGALNSTASCNGFSSAGGGPSSTRYGSLDSAANGNGFGSAGELRDPGSTRYGALDSTVSGNGIGSAFDAADRGSSLTGVGSAFGAADRRSPLTGVGSAFGAAAGGSSLYEFLPSSTWVPSRDYLSQSAHYSLSSSYGHEQQVQHNQAARALPAPGVTPGGIYQGMPYYNYNN